MLRRPVQIEPQPCDARVEVKEILLPTRSNNSGAGSLYRHALYHLLLAASLTPHVPLRQARAECASIQLFRHSRLRCPGFQQPHT